MKLSNDLIEEIDLLNLFTLDSSQAGLKIHHDAAATRVAAGIRLFEKDLISQQDGGYLTPLGIQAAEHAQALMIILLTKNAAELAG